MRTYFSGLTGWATVAAVTVGVSTVAAGCARSPEDTGTGSSAALDTSFIVGSPTVEPTDAISGRYAGCDTNDQQYMTFGQDLTAVVSNLCYGGAVWEYWWNNVPFIDSISAGAAMQTAYFQWEDASAGAAVVNPTEAGDDYTLWTTPLAQRHGAATLWAQVNPGGQWGNWATTLSQPLEFGPSGTEQAGAFNEVPLGGGPHNAVAYSDVVTGKNIFPSYLGRTDATMYQTLLHTPSALPNTTVVVPAAYLMANFSQITEFDAGAGGTATSVPLPQPTCDASGFAISQAGDSVWYTPGACGGLLATDPSTGYTFGLYGCTPDAGGSVTTFQVYDQDCNPADDGPFEPSAMPLYALFDNRYLAPGSPAATYPAAGWNIFQVVIVTGTSLENAEGRMVDLYNSGVRGAIVNEP